MSGRYDHMCTNTSACRYNVINNVHVNNAFLLEILSILKAIESDFNGSYDKQNLTLVVISYEMTTSVRSSMYYFCLLSQQSRGQFLKERIYFFKSRLHFKELPLPEKKIGTH